MPRQLTLKVGLRDGAVFEAFHAADNALCLNSLSALAEGRGETQLYIWGAPGSGKSHLLQAACHRAREVGLSTAYLPLDAMPESGGGVLEDMEAHEVLCLDALDAVLGVPAWDLALFNLINASRALGHRMVFASHDNPAHMPISLPDLRSRLLWGAVHRLQALDDEAKLAALRQRAHRRGFELPEEAGRYLLKVCPRDLGDLLEVLERLDHATLASQRKVTIPFIKTVLGV